MTAHELHAVLLEQDIAVDARKHGRDIARIVGQPLVEIRMTIRKGRGILLEDLPREQAEAVAAILRADGIACRVVAAEDLPVLPPFRRIVQLKRTGEGLQFRAGGAEEWEPLPWFHIALVSAGAVALPQYREFFSHIAFHQLPGLHTLDDPSLREVVRENLILKMSAPPVAKTGKPSLGDKTVWERIEEEWSRKIKVYIDLLPRGFNAWLRFGMDEFSYVFQEDKPQLGSAWGFALLLKDLREFSPASFTDMTLQLESLRDGDIRPLVFSQAEEFNRYTTWAAFLDHLRAVPERENPAPDSTSQNPG